MSTYFGLEDIVPLGAGIELLDENDPAVTPRILAIEASSMGEATRIIKRYHDYRMWHQLQSLDSRPEVMPADDGGDLVASIQKLYWHNDDEFGFGEGVESVTLTFPKAVQPTVTTQLSRFPPSICPVAGSPLGSSGKSIHVKGRAGTRSLLVLEQPLEIEVPDRSIFACLNNPAKPGWVVFAPRNKPPMAFGHNLRAVSTHDISENAAWDKVSLWLESRGFIVSAKPYPEGKNSFPDFRAWINGLESDVEVTSVPDMTAWTLKRTYRKLEERISEIAKQPGQTRREVIDDFLRKCSDKRQRVESKAVGGRRRPCMLVVSNWSAHALADQSSHFGRELSFFDVVMLIEFDHVHLIHPR